MKTLTSMKVFIWKYLGVVSDRYHSGGGVVIVAKNLRRARSIYKYEAYSIDWSPDSDKEYETTVYNTEPDLTYNLKGEYKEEVVNFPNAGCC